MEPKFILSKSITLKQFNKIKELTDLVSYSSKTNPEVTKILEENTSCYFSIHSENELIHVKDKKRVIFLAQSWTQKQIQKLINQGIDFFVIDNEPDLMQLLEFIQEKKVKINLLLRMKLKELTIRTEKYFVFGMNSETINKWIPKLKENKFIEKIGVHFHRKTQNMSEWNLQFELENALNEKSFELIDFINIGGGIPSVYANTNEDVIESIFNKLKEIKKWVNSKKIKLILEPGRFISAPAVKLETEIIGLYENNIVVNASVYNTDLDALIVPVKLLVEGEVEKEKGTPFVIKGITPCSLDLFRYRVYLNSPKIGDKITFLNAGAYNFASDFCDLKKIKTELIE
ncbi:MAG: decarboxylase [Candidatus Diapherotrites archaeon]|nr:decarboxylase [Candidatus Diapherotrites archaeon]